MAEAKSKRKKPNSLYPVKDLQEANAVLAEIGALKRRIEAIESESQERIDQIKAEADAEKTPLKARMESMGTGLNAFSEYNKSDLFPKKRSVELTFGTLGYRRSSEIGTKPKRTLAMVLGRLKELGFKQAIRTTEQVNKEELRTWPDERLDLVGARRIEKDEFWYEVTQEEINPGV
jgi:phage host-nuclease inhibitor protein Gam